jgi:hypothetical protein
MFFVVYCVKFLTFSKFIIFIWTKSLIFAKVHNILFTLCFVGTCTNMEMNLIGVKFGVSLHFVLSGGSSKMTSNKKKLKLQSCWKFLERRQ